VAPILGARAGAVARGLIETHGSLGAVLAAETGLLAEQMDGDPRAAQLLVTAREMHLFLLREPLRDREIVGSLSQLHAYLRADLEHQRTERIRVLFLSSTNRLLRDEVVMEGCLDEAPLYVREILRRALQVGAAAIIVVHNHPSGDSKPSQSDIEVTRRLCRAGQPLGVVVHDHLVVASSGIVSMREQGLL